MSEIVVARLFIAICLVMALLAVSNPSLFAADPPPVTVTVPGDGISIE